MKIRYNNTPINRQRNHSPSVKTLILISCLVFMMVAIKVAYDPKDPLPVSGTENAEMVTENHNIP